MKIGDSAYYINVLESPKTPHICQIVSFDELTVCVVEAYPSEPLRFIRADLVFEHRHECINRCEAMNYEDAFVRSKT